MGCELEGSRRSKGYSTSDQSIQGLRLGELTESSCAALNFPVFGVEYRTECYCGSTLSIESVTMAPSADCSLSCNGSPKDNCGAWSRMNVYSATVPLSAATAASMTGENTATSSSSSPSSPSLPSSSAVTLSKGAVGGIAVGSAFGAVLVCAAIYFCFHRRHGKSRKASHNAMYSSGQRPLIQIMVRPRRSR